ncbi:MAG: hypothetical protein WC819_05395 [Parcubacteria group bacterium]|jgi:hypothetical protein
MNILKDLTKEDANIPVFQISNFSFFPHVFVESLPSCPNCAVFSIKDDARQETTYMAISANVHVSPFGNTWREVFDDFLAFARANSLFLKDCIGMNFFKNSPENYTSESMGSIPELKAYKKGGEVNVIHEKPFSNDRHPELEPGEMFLCNTSEESFIAFLWKTKRRGKIAYSIFGDLVNDKRRKNDEDLYYPVFIQMAEVKCRGIGNLNGMQPADS